MVPLRKERHGAHTAAPRRKPNARWYSRRKTTAKWAIVGVLGAAVIGLASFEFGYRAVGCDIKGNISETGERIYHVPGQDYYAETRIDFLRGERFFCSESDARIAGWRRSRATR